nr:glycosyltransferase [Desulfobacula sp.]
MEKGIAAVVKHTHGEFEHIIMCLTTGGDSEKMLPRGVQVIALHKPAGNSLNFIFKIAKQIKALEPDVVHTRNWGGLDGIIAARLAGIRGVVHGEHGWGMEDPLGKNPKRKMIRRVLAGFVKEFTCVSQQMVSWLREDIRVRRPVTQIYNGIDTRRYRPGPETKDSLRVIGVIGRLDPIKDHPTLFRAFEQVARSMPQTRLMVIGDGPERQKLEAMAKNLTEADIRFAGNRLDVPDLLWQMDLFVLPSLNEGISNTILEAMASGVPVIATRAGGNPELVTDGETGALFTPGNQDQLAGLMEKFLKDEPLRKLTGKKARESVIQRFSMTNMAAGYTDVWRRVAGK